MKFIYCLVFIAIGFAFPVEAIETEEPPLPFYDMGACPFECCTYGKWTASKDTELRKDHDDLSSPVTVVKGGEDVQGITGVVITTKTGKVKIISETILSVENSSEQIRLLPGDVIYYLRYVGEGYDKFWFKGIFLVEQTSIMHIGKSESLEVLNLPEWVWWAKIRRQNGKVGWTREMKNFTHVDACE
jgi:hypothetical protein